MNCLYVLSLMVSLALPALAFGQGQRGQPLKAGMVIEADFKAAPGEYRLSSDDLDAPAITVRGEGVTVDLTGARLLGSDEPTRPDRFTGLAVRVEGKNVTIKGLHARGYKVAVMAKDVDGLTIGDCDLSYNWRQQMKSDPWKEDLGDWMSYHNNEEDQWLRFGAAIYLRGCDNFAVHGNTVVGGQNALLLTDSNDGMVHSNQFSFNSSLGLGMYRSSRNRIMRNRMDFNVRGHSEGVYNRGQDSAAILIYEQSHENIFAWNSATHSGDGFFLWAGQTTMDTGEGGCNDNLLYENDFSYAPTNGVEITFARNQVIGNRMHGCWHGIWGGYSFQTLILANDFADNEDAISIEHGNNNSIGYNRFEGDETAIRLFTRRPQNPDWGYPKFRDTDSHGYNIFLNEFIDVGTAVLARDTQNIKGFGNEFEGVQAKFDLEGTEFIEVTPAQAPDATRQGRLDAFRPEPIEGAQTPDPLVEHPEKRDAIRVTQWGPYDYRRPILWPEVAKDPTGRTLTAHGPRGKWEIIESNVGDPQFEGDRDGQPTGLKLEGQPGQVTDLLVKFRWTGEQDIIDEFGRVVPAGEPYEWTYSRFVAPIDWSVKFFTYDEESEPRTRPEAFAEVMAGEPVATLETDHLDLRGSRPWAEGVPADKFATVAEGMLEAPAGEYVFSVTSDDGIRLWLDNELIHEDWTHHAPRTVEVPVTLGGRHTLRLEHFEIDGYAALQIELKRPE